MFNLQIKSLSKYIAASTLLISFLTYLEILDVYKIYFNDELIFHDHQYWRLFTSLLYFGPTSIMSLWNLYIFVTRCSTIEREQFYKQPADFLLFLLIGACSCWVCAMFTPEVFLGGLFMSYLTYYFCKIFSHANFGIGFVLIRAPLLPLIEIVIDFFFDRNIINSLFVIFIAHLYFYIHDVANIKYDKNYLRLPNKFNEALQVL